jgi:hypothetical protein
MPCCGSRMTGCIGAPRTIGRFASKGAGGGTNWALAKCDK